MQYNEYTLRPYQTKFIRMKLISKTLFYYLLISLPLLVTASYFSYYLIFDEVREGTDISLWKEKRNAENLIKTFDVPKDVVLSTDGFSRIRHVDHGGPKYIFTDTLIYDKDEEENVNHRILNAFVKVKDNYYQITLAKPTLEEDALIEGLGSSLLMVLGFLVLSFFAVNWLLSQWLWKPFYKTIDQLREYDIKKAGHVRLERSGTREFDQLNTTLNEMSEKIFRDFIHQKEFTENAAHEMQTPLAVIKAKLDLLIQSPNLKEEEMNQLQSIDTSVSKLASLNKALLLLAKIENNQFKEATEINLTQVIEKTLLNYEEVIDSKQLSLKKELEGNVMLRMNPVLCEILISNLIQNATRHNISRGFLNIKLTADSLTVSNSGNSLNIKAEELFERFKKNDASRESIGLGLSIVKSITALYNVKISYNYLENTHTFTLHFNKTELNQN